MASVAARRLLLLRRVPRRDVLRLHRRVYTRARVRVRTKIQSCREGGGTARPRSEPVATDSCLVPSATRGCPVYVTVCLLAHGL